MVRTKDELLKQSSGLNTKLTLQIQKVEKTEEEGFNEKYKNKESTNQQNRQEHETHEEHRIHRWGNGTLGSVESDETHDDTATK